MEGRQLRTPHSTIPSHSLAHAITRPLAHSLLQVALLVAFQFAVVFPLGWELSPDESGQLGLCKQPLRVIVTTFQQAQNHPLFAVLAHWSLKVFPTPVYAFRAPAVVAGLLLPLAFYFTERRRAAREAAIVIALLLVIVDPLRYYATAGRGYSMLALGIVLMNHLLLRYFEEPKFRYVIGYGLITVVACYTHLFAGLVVAAHAVFLTVEALRKGWYEFSEPMSGTKGLGARDEGSAGKHLPEPYPLIPDPSSVRHGLARTFAPPLLGLLAAAGIAFVLYLPMLPEIRAMAGSRRGTPLFLGLFESLLELFRFANWTLAAFVLLVPILLEGGARQLKRSAIGREVRLHVTVIASVVALVLVTQPSNFGSRFLIGILPSAASLGAWALSGYWTGSRDLKTTLLPVAGMWLIGFGLGVLAACAPISHNIPVGAHVNSAGEDQGYYHRALPLAIGKTGGCILLLVGILTTAFVCRKNRQRSAVSGQRQRLNPGSPKLRATWLDFAVPVFWTAIVVLSIIPLALGAEFFSVRWPVEMHTVAVATVALLTWRHRFDNTPLYALRYALLVAGLIILVWQFRMDVQPVSVRTISDLAAIFPPAAILIGVARTSDPA